MKKLHLFYSVLLFHYFLPTVYAIRSARMKYQWPEFGEVMADQQFQSKLHFRGMIIKTVHYTEVHDVTTNQFGLFSLVVDGAVTQGDFNKIPWSSEDIWMEMDLRMQENLVLQLVVQNY
jgi:hypothetical protein